MLQLMLEFYYTGSISLNICDRPLFDAVEFNQFVPKKDSITGLIVALLIINIWAASLTFLLYFDVSKFPNWLIPIAIIWQTFLYTGLFITAHDAMHGAIYQKNIKINNFIGSLSVILYALFSYRQLLKKHWLHHHHPASEKDPDFYDGKRKNGIIWYFHFMKEYWSWHQLIGLTLVYNLAKYALQIPETHLLLFWAIPPILSSIQLFYFGTFLPHREPEEGYVRPHCAQTIRLSVFWSFITCYHFGYHQEHHEFPQVPWWQLPVVYKQKIQ
ncbi:beta-carotene ketolase CrtW [Chlorogloeopsis sp. ULAP02]|uniref:beta-carotene ketolase CrtW n=1 Tax=Chlorogloeopsis sp. ULAP02 TaxID=3107926 RepID=UPI0031358570